MTTPDITWDAVLAAIGNRIWELAPADFAESGHRDLCWPVCWQNLMGAVERGIRDCYPDEASGGES